MYHRLASLSAVPLWMILLMLLLAGGGQGFTLSTCPTMHPCRCHRQDHDAVLLRMSSDDWSGFTALDDDDDDDNVLDRPTRDTRTYAVEDDDDEIKAAVGASLDAPQILDPYPAEALMVPAGSALEMSQDTVLAVLQAAREELGTLFGYSAENRGVGITGGVDFVEMDGPTVVIRLKGRFWHQRTTVLDRVANYLQQRIPEIVQVDVEDPYQLTDEANEVW